MKRQMPAFVVPFCIQLRKKEYLLPKTSRMMTRASHSEILVTTTTKKDDLQQKHPKRPKMVKLRNIRCW